MSDREPEYGEGDVYAKGEWIARVRYSLHYKTDRHVVRAGGRRSSVEGQTDCSGSITVIEGDIYQHWHNRLMLRLEDDSERRISIRSLGTKTNTHDIECDGI
jgi:hypothetical protein